MAEANGGLAQRPCSNKVMGAELIVPNPPRPLYIYTAAERGTSDETEATHQRAHDQRRRLEHCKNDWVTLTQFGHLSCKSSIVLCNSGNQKWVEIIQTFLQ